MTTTSLLDIFFPLYCPLCGNPFPQIPSSYPVHIHIGDETLTSSYHQQKFPKELETKFFPPEASVCYLMLWNLYARAHKGWQLHSWVFINSENITIC